MKLLATTVFTLAITTASFAHIYQYSDCDENGTLLLTELEPVPEVDLSGLYLGCADLTGATGANLYHADLHGADLTDAHLTGVNLNGANLSFASLSDANMDGAYGWQNGTWSGATYNDATVFPAGMNPEKFGMIYEGIVTGACCVTSGCDVMEEAMCTNLGGTWTEVESCDDCVAPPETCDGDINADGVVDIDDLLLLISYFGNTCM
jgi:uncharacterized protein YjbI with pentapeptide repeats